MNFNFQHKFRRYWLYPVFALCAFFCNNAFPQSSISTNKTFMLNDGLGGTTNNALPPSDSNFFVINSNLLNQAVSPNSSAGVSSVNGQNGNIINVLTNADARVWTNVSGQVTVSNAGGNTAQITISGSSATGGTSQTLQSTPAGLVLSGQLQIGSSSSTFGSQSVSAGEFLGNLLDVGAGATNSVFTNGVVVATPKGTNAFGDGNWTNSGAVQFSGIPGGGGYFAALDAGGNVSAAIPAGGSGIAIQGGQGSNNILYAPTLTNAVFYGTSSFSLVTNVPLFYSNATGGFSATMNTNRLTGTNNSGQTFDLEFGTGAFTASALTDGGVLSAPLLGTSSGGTLEPVSYASVTNGINAFVLAMGQIITNLFQPTNNNLTLFSALGSGPGVLTNSSATSTPAFSWVAVGGGGGGGGSSTFNNNQFFSGGTGPVTNLQTNQTFAALTLTQGITYGASGTNAYPANGRTNMWGGGMLTNILNGATNIFYGGVSSKGYTIFLYPTGNVTTDTANVQAAFNFPDSVVIYMARGLYYWNQITFPTQADSPNRTLEVHGANAFPTGQDQATLGLVQVDGTGYTIISNNLTGGLWGQALIMPATTTGFNYTQVNMDKLIFLTPTNPSYGILNLSNTVGHNINIEVLNASEYVVTSPYPIIPTNTNAVAIYCAAQPNDGELDGCLISGYYWGIVAGDGTYLHNCFFFCCSNSILTGLAGQLGVVHNLYFDRLYEIECVNGITSGSNSPVNIHGSDWIADYDQSDPAHWGVPRHDLNDNKNNFYTPPYGIAYNQGGYNTNYAPTNFGGSNFLFSSYPNPLQPQLTFGAPFLNLLCSNITAYGAFSQANAGSSWTSGSQTQGIGSQGNTNNQNMFIQGGQNSGNYVDISSYYTEGAVYNDVYTWAVRPNASAANGLQFLYQQSLGLNSGLDHGGLVINNLPIVISPGNALGGAYWAWNIPLSGGNWTPPAQGFVTTLTSNVFSKSNIFSEWITTNAVNSSSSAIQVSNTWPSALLPGTNGQLAVKITEVQGQSTDGTVSFFTTNTILVIFTNSPAVGYGVLASNDSNGVLVGGQAEFGCMGNNGISTFRADDSATGWAISWAMANSTATRETIHGTWFWIK